MTREERVPTYLMEHPEKRAIFYVSTAMGDRQSKSAKLFVGEDQRLGGQASLRVVPAEIFLIPNEFLVFTIGETALGATSRLEITSKKYLLISEDGRKQKLDPVGVEEFNFDETPWAVEITPKPESLA